MGGVVRRARGRIRGAALVAVLILGVAGALSLTAHAQPNTVLLSAAPDGSEGAGPYFASPPSVSRDGAHVAFASAAANLVDGDDNGAVDVFVRDRGADGSWRTTLVSASPDGEPGNADSYSPSISADGSVVAFASEATNLDGGGGVGRPDVFLWHRGGMRVARISRGLLGGLADGGSYSPAVSGDGSVVAFASDAPNLVVGDLNGLTDVFVWRHDPVTGLVSLLRVLTRLLGEPKGNSYQPAVSAEGNVVAFASDAPNLVAGDDNDTIDVFAYDRSTGTTTLVSKGAGGKAADGPSFSPAVSGKGERVAFVSMAADLGSADAAQPNVYVYDRDAGAPILVSRGAGGEPADSSSFSPAISADGRYVAFDSAASNLAGGDGNGDEDVFVHDTATGATTMVPTAGGKDEQAFCPGISPDGAYVAFALAPADYASTQYYLHGPMFGDDPAGTRPVEQETSTTAGTTTTTEAPPTTSATTFTEPAVTETTGG
jgi:Tol biopolymer transport system component